MTKAEIREKIELANKLVESWPVWKRNILVNSSKSSVSVPRPPVDNRGVDKQDVLD